MIRYSRLGIDYSIKAKPRVKHEEKKGVDWINIILLFMLFLVVVIFIFGK